MFNNYTWYQIHAIIGGPIVGKNSVEGNMASWNLEQHHQNDQPPCSGRWKKQSLGYSPPGLAFDAAIIQAPKILYLQKVPSLEPQMFWVFPRHFVSPGFHSNIRRTHRSWHADATWDANFQFRLQHFAPQIANIRALHKHKRTHTFIPNNHARPQVEFVPGATQWMLTGTFGIWWIMVGKLPVNQTRATIYQIQTNRPNVCLPPRRGKI